MRAIALVRWSEAVPCLCENARADTCFHSTCQRDEALARVAEEMNARPSPRFDLRSALRAGPANLGGGVTVHETADGWLAEEPAPRGEKTMEDT